jgi:integrase
LGWLRAIALLPPRHILVVLARATAGLRWIPSSSGETTGFAPIYLVGPARTTRRTSARRDSGFRDAAGLLSHFPRHVPGPGSLAISGERSASAAKGRKSKKKKERRTYSRNSIGVWFRVFRTMTRDAMVALDLPRDPTLRVSLPESRVDYSEPNSLTPEQLVAFLEAMRTHYPQHYALVATLAYTGLRFCHASALRWEDWDEPSGVLRVVRKHFRGEIGPVSRKKQAPKEYPVEPELADILREHRKRLPRTQADGLAKGWMFPPRKGRCARQTRWTARGRSASSMPRSRSGSPSTGCATRSPTWYAGRTWTRWSAGR